MQLPETFHQEFKHTVLSPVDLCPLPSTDAPSSHLSVLSLAFTSLLSLNEVFPGFSLHLPGPHLNWPALLAASYVLVLSRHFFKNGADLVSTPSRFSLSKIYLNCSEVYSLSVLGTIFSFSYLETSGI